MAIPAFTGGKMPSLFKRHQTPAGYVYVEPPEATDAEALAALRGGHCYLKVHGEAAALTYEEDDVVTLRFLRRRDLRAEPTDGFVPMPDGANPSVVHGARAHFYAYEVLPRTAATKKDASLGSDTYAAAEMAALCTDQSGHITVEWVGAKHQGNIDDYPFKHGVVVHSECELAGEHTPRTWEALVRFAQTWDVEGLVYQHPVTGKYFKFRFDALPGALFRDRKRGAKTTLRAPAYGPEGEVPTSHPEMFAMLS